MLSFKLPILRTINISLPSSHHTRVDHFAASWNPNFSLLRFRLAWGSKCDAAAKKDQIQRPECQKQKLTPKHVAPLFMGRSRRQGLKQLATNCSKLSEQDMNSEKGTNSDDRRSTFVGVYSVLKSELLNDPTFEWTDYSRLWVEQMLDYTVPRGKLHRGLLVIHSYILLKEGEELTEAEMFHASVLGWCIEWFGACMIVHDDFMDNSQTRRGIPCWFRVPKVGKIAVNDGMILLNHIHRILKKHFREKAYYLDLLDLFNEVEFQTISGQMLDLITTTQGEKDLSNYSMHLYRRIAQYKTAYYTFYLPIGCALVIAGENLEDHVNVKDVLLDMGIYFQVVDDYLDCFGDPQKTGKIGTDIEDFKCSWLVVKALELCDEEQKKIIYEHYGKANPSDVEKVKGVYNEMNLQGEFADYDRKEYNRLRSCVEAHPNKAVKAIWARYTSHHNYNLF